MSTKGGAVGVLNVKNIDERLLKKRSIRICKRQCSGGNHKICARNEAAGCRLFRSPWPGSWTDSCWWVGKWHRPSTRLRVPMTCWITQNRQFPTPRRHPKASIAWTAKALSSHASGEAQSRSSWIMPTLLTECLASATGFNPSTENATRIFWTTARVQFARATPRAGVGCPRSLARPAAGDGGTGPALAGGEEGGDCRVALRTSSGSRRDGVRQSLLQEFFLELEQLNLSRARPHI